MLTDEEIIARAQQISDDSAHYGFWLSKVLSYPPHADIIYKENPDSIHRIAAACRKRYGVPTQKLYRGVIVEKKYIKNGRLIPDPKVPTISFSECIECARQFADIDSEISTIVKMFGGKGPGHLIEYTPEPDEVLFWWRWLEPMGIMEQTKNREIIEEQKEVILMQRLRWFNLRKYEK